MGHWKDYYGWPRYVPVAERKAQAEKKMAKLRAKGKPVSPVKIEGRTIARTFWGQSWCENLECYSDYDNRLPRGRAYVRNGSVVDLQIGPGEVKAMVAGSSLYQVEVQVAPLSGAKWKAICADCAGGIDSLVELLQGRFSKAVMDRICRMGAGLFPAPGEIKFSCSCPDWAGMCKHVAAVFYGIGSRLDHQPELLFRLRKVDEKELLACAGSGIPLTGSPVVAEKVLADANLGEIFGLELAAPAAANMPGEPNPEKKVGRRGRPKLKPEAPVAGPPAEPTAPRRRGRPRKEKVSAIAPAVEFLHPDKKTGRKKKPVARKRPRPPSGS